MPIETQAAINWALQQQYEIDEGVFINVTPDIPFTVVCKVREYFNNHGITYDSFSFDGLQLYL